MIVKKLAGLFLFWSVASGHTAGLLTDHVDITFNYTPTGWVALLGYGGEFDETNLQADTESFSLPARDFAAGPSGDRLTQPASAAFAFTGAAVGAPLWNLPQNDRGFTYPGLRNEQAPSVFLAYSNPDSRVSTGIFKWLKIQLVSVEYSGESLSAPHFSLWTASGSGPPIIWMATSDGITGSDHYWALEGTHNHLNWGFTALGIYRVTMRASAFLQSTGQPTESEDHAVTFAIGTLAMWRATHFSGPDLVDVNIGVPTADPDADGSNNLIEYAFNMHPRDSSTAAITTGTGISGLPLIQVENVNGQDRLTIEFVRRKASTNPQIVYVPEFISDLTSGNWEAGGTTLITPVAGENDWERVKVTDSLNLTPETRRFGRVRVALLSQVAY